MRHHRTLIRRLRAELEGLGFGPAVVRLVRAPGHPARPFYVELWRGTLSCLGRARGTTKAEALWLLGWTLRAATAAHRPRGRA